MTTNEPLTEGDCNDPTHDFECGCGATPSLDYERGIDA